MTYKDELIKAMILLTIDKIVIFLGQNILYIVGGKTK